MKKLMHSLRGRQGGASIQAVVLILVISMLFSVTLAYASLLSVISATKEDTQRVLDSFLIENATQIYDSVRQGSNRTAMREYTAQFEQEICVELGLEKSGNLLYTKGKEIIYCYANLLTTNLKNDTLELKADFELILPVRFAGREWTQLHIPLEVRSLYMLKAI